MMAVSDSRNRVRLYQGAGPDSFLVKVACVFIVTNVSVTDCLVACGSYCLLCCDNAIVDMEIRSRCYSIGEKLYSL